MKLLLKLIIIMFLVVQTSSADTMKPSGYVVDTSSNTLQDVLVTYWNTTFNILTITDPSGYYNLSSSLSNGTYNFSATKSGYAITYGNGTFFSNGTVENNITLYGVNINGITYNARSGVILPNVNINISVPDFWGNSTTKWFNTTSDLNGIYRLDGFVVDKIICFNATKSEYIHQDFNTTLIYHGNYIANLYLLPTNPCPNKVCGITLSYPWHQALASSSVSLWNNTNSTTTTSNSFGYFEFSNIADNTTYSINASKSKYSTVSQSFTVYNNTGIQFLVLHPFYNLTIRATDDQSTAFISTFTSYINSFAGVATTNGEVVYQLNYSLNTVSVTATNYYSLQKQVFVQTDTTEIFNLNKLTTTIEYVTSHYVKFIIQDITGKKYDNTTVQIYHNSVLLFTKPTGSDGAVGFKLNQTLPYVIRFYSTVYGFDKNYTIYPVETVYTLLPLPNTTSLFDGLTYSLTTTSESVTFTWNDVYNETLFVNMSISNVSAFPIYEYYSIVSTNESTPSNNYSIRISNDTYSIPTTMWDLMNHNGNDTRFYNIGKSKKFGFWIERLNSQTDFSIWINVTDAGTGTFIWFYGYDNATESNHTNITENSNNISLLSISPYIPIQVGNSTILYTSSVNSSLIRNGVLSYTFPISTIVYSVNITIPTISHGIIVIMKVIKPIGYEIPFPGVPDWLIMSVGLFFLFIIGMMFGYNHAGIGALIVAGMAIMFSAIGLFKLSEIGQGVLVVAIFLAIIGLLRGRR